MFNSAILDVIIGLAFVYTLLSMICSALTEWFARFTSLRSKTLLKGIQSLLGDEDTERLYKHLLIKGLAEKDGKPSYIPAHTFFFAVMDIIMGSKQSGISHVDSTGVGKFEEVRQMIATLSLDSEIKKGLLDRINAVTNLSSDSEINKGLLDQIEGIAKSPGDREMKQKQLANIDAQIAKIKNLIGSKGQSKPPTETTKELKKIHEFKDAVVNLPLDSGIKKAFFTLMNNPEVAIMDDEKEQLKRVQKNAEKWFDDAMDRVSGWYKRNTQVVILLCALVVTVLANVDTLKIVNELWYEYDETARNAIVSAASGFIREREDLEALESPVERLTQLQEELQKPPLPIGWSREEQDRFKNEWPTMIVGWVLTVIAVSLGAPFWFELLNKIVSLRLAGNRPPKASKEKTE